LRVREEIMGLAKGRADLRREFARLQAVDQAAKQIQAEFTRQTKAIDAAMQRLLLDGQSCPPNHFTSVLEKGLTQLHEWKTRVPELLARVERD